MSDAPDNFAIWAEIPVADLDRSIAFYRAVFQLDPTVQDPGPGPIAMFPTADGNGVSCHLYLGRPATLGEGPTIHLVVPDSLKAAAERVRAAGGTVLSEPIQIPDGSFVYCQDPDGNSIGLFQSAG